MLLVEERAVVLESDHALFGDRHEVARARHDAVVHDDVAVRDELARLLHRAREEFFDEQCLEAALHDVVDREAEDVIEVRAGFDEAKRDHAVHEVLALDHGLGVRPAHEALRAILKARERARHLVQLGLVVRAVRPLEAALFLDA